MAITEKSNLSGILILKGWQNLHDQILFETFKKSHHSRGDFFYQE